MLQEQAFTDVEMPGQYLAGHEIAPEAVVYLDRIGANAGMAQDYVVGLLGYLNLTPGMPSLLQEQAFTYVEMPGQYLAGHEIAPEAVVYLDRIGANAGMAQDYVMGLLGYLNLTPGMPSLLQEQAFTDVEMPGQYLAGHEIAPEAVVYLDRIGANVGIVRRHATSYRRLALQGSDGRTVHFLVQTGQHWSTTCGARLIIFLSSHRNCVQGYAFPRGLACTGEQRGTSTLRRMLASRLCYFLALA